MVEPQSKQYETTWVWIHDKVFGSQQQFSQKHTCITVDSSFSLQEGCKNNNKLCRVSKTTNLRLATLPGWVAKHVNEHPVAFLQRLLNVLYNFFFFSSKTHQLFFNLNWKANQTYVQAFMRPVTTMPLFVDPSSCLPLIIPPAAHISHLLLASFCSSMPSTLDQEAQLTSPGGYNAVVAMATWWHRGVVIKYRRLLWISVANVRFFPPSFAWTVSHLTPTPTPNSTLCS